MPTPLFTHIPPDQTELALWNRTALHGKPGDVEHPDVVVVVVVVVWLFGCCCFLYTPTRLGNPSGVLQILNLRIKFLLT